MNKQHSYRAEFDHTEAEYQRASSQTELARNDADRAKRLIGTKAISEEDYDKNLKTYIAAQATEKSAKATLESAKLNLEFTEIRSPINGRVSRAIVTEGNLISSGVAGSGATLLTTVVSLDPLYLYGDADERAILKYRKLRREGTRVSACDEQIPAEMGLASGSSVAGAAGSGGGREACGAKTIGGEELSDACNQFAKQMRVHEASVATASQRKEIAEAEELVEDLRRFREELNRVAPLFKPNLNDGVIINHAPLWRIPSHSPWQKKLKQCWDELVKAEYDWSHLAMHLWPERVVPKCAKDRSLAIAHDLEETFWQPDSENEGKCRKASLTIWLLSFVRSQQNPLIGPKSWRH